MNQVGSALPQAYVGLHEGFGFGGAAQRRASIFWPLAYLMDGFPGSKVQQTLEGRSGPSLCMLEIESHIPSSCRRMS